MSLLLHCLEYCNSTRNCQSWTWQLSAWNSQQIKTLDHVCHCFSIWMVNSVIVSSCGMQRCSITKSLQSGPDLLQARFLHLCGVKLLSWSQDHLCRDKCVHWMQQHWHHCVSNHSKVIFCCRWSKEGRAGSKQRTAKPAKIRQLWQRQAQTYTLHALHFHQWHAAVWMKLQRKFHCTFDAALYKSQSDG